MFYFHEFLEKIGLDIQQTRLLRHNDRGLAAWQSGQFQKFGCYASFQRLQPSPYAGALYACQFVKGPMLANGQATALFIGVTKILRQWPWDGQRLPRLQNTEIIESERDFENVEAFDLEWLDAGNEYSERILIHWGTGALAWSQWAEQNLKEIIEIRRDRHEPPFPGFSRFLGQISKIQQLPITWQNVLKSVGGIYLLVTENGDQYIGSASGQDGFLGRWLNYAANGHGGNVLLNARGHQDYSVAILEVASPDMSQTEIILREQHWKNKLGVRAHGLNLN